MDADPCHPQRSLLLSGRGRPPSTHNRWLNGRSGAAGGLLGNAASTTLWQTLTITRKARTMGNSGDVAEVQERLLERLHGLYLTGHDVFDVCLAADYCLTHSGWVPSGPCQTCT